MSTDQFLCLLAVIELEPEVAGSGGRDGLDQVAILLKGFWLEPKRLSMTDKCTASIQDWHIVGLHKLRQVRSSFGCQLCEDLLGAHGHLLHHPRDLCLD